MICCGSSSLEGAGGAARGLQTPFPMQNPPRCRRAGQPPQKSAGVPKRSSSRPESNAVWFAAGARRWRELGTPHGGLKLHWASMVSSIMGMDPAPKKAAKVPNRSSSRPESNAVWFAAGARRWRELDPPQGGLIPRPVNFHRYGPGSEKGGKGTES